MSDMDRVPETKKALGQHWLHDNASLDAMCIAAKVTAGDTVLEVGPGTGTLTRKLLDTGASVVAVELDESLIASLEKSITSKVFSLHQQSILTFDLTAMPAGYKMVANIPYYLTSNLIRVISESSNPPETAVLLIQKEVAERVAALPGDMSLLSVTAQFYWQTKLGMEVPAELFTPPPKVDSQILILVRIDGTRFPDMDPKLFFRLVKAGFSNRRKTLENALNGGLRLSKSDIRTLLEGSSVQPTMRAQELSMTQWQELYTPFKATLENT